MRDDFSQLLTERPRRQTPVGYDRARSSRRLGELEDRPSKMGMRREHTSRKSLNENLNPLQRFLQRNVGRPWDKVYADIHKHVNASSAVQAHILTHLRDFVVTDVLLAENGTPMVPGGMHQLESLAERYRYRRDAFGHFYVHPRTGLLLKVPKPNRKTSAALSLQGYAVMHAYHGSIHKSTRVLVNANEVLERIDGVWYYVQTAPIDVLIEASARLSRYMGFGTPRSRQLSAQCNGGADYVSGLRFDVQHRAAFERRYGRPVGAIGLGLPLSRSALVRRGLTNT